jgi:hypothetical protein
MERKEEMKVEFQHVGILDSNTQSLEQVTRRIVVEFFVVLLHFQKIADQATHQIFTLPWDGF